MKRIIALVLFLVGAVFSRAAEIDYPEDAFDNVSNPPTVHHFVNILDFGADPTGQTDSLPAIQSALNYLGVVETGAGVEPRTKGIYFPTGTYTVSGSIDEKWVENATGSTTSGSTIITGLSTTANIGVGFSVVPHGSASDTTFPAGTTISKIDSSTQIEVSKAATATVTAEPLQYQNNICRVALIGENESNTVIQLAAAAAANNPFFTGTATHPPAVIRTESVGTTGNDADADMIWNLIVDIGSQNPGITGVIYQANNMSSMRDVTIRSLDTGNQGKFGIDMGVAYCGPCLLSNVTVTGFQTGISVGQEYDSVTLDTIALHNQTVVGLANNGNSVFVNNLTSTNSVPAVSNTGTSSLLSMINSTATGGSSVNSAVVNSGSCFLRNFVSAGYNLGVANTGQNPSNSGAPTGTLTGDYTSQAVKTTGIAGTLTTSLNLPIQATPTADFTTDPPSNWYDVESAGVTPDPNPNTKPDQTAAINLAIQNAAATGKYTLYFPPGRYYVTGPLQVYGSIQRILGGGAGAGIEPVSYTSGTGFGNTTGTATPVFVFGSLTNSSQDMSGPVELDHVLNIYSSSAPNNLFVDHNTTQPLVIRDCELGGNSSSTGTTQGYGAAYTAMTSSSAHAGDFYEEDCDGTFWNFVPGQSIWARQFDTEGYTVTPKISNNGGTLWILGLKTEQDGMVLEATNNSSSEIIGGFNYCTHTASTPHLYDVQNSNFSASFDTAGSVDYPNLVGETEGAATGTLYCASSTLTPKVYIRDSHNSSIAPLAVAAVDFVPGVDIGSVGLTGTGTCSNSVYTIQGAGTAIHETADSFHFCSEESTGNCTITAEVNSLQNSSAGAEAGVMMRESTAPGAIMAGVFMFNDECQAICRTSTGGSATVKVIKPTTLPIWVQLQRSGSTFNFSTSPNGVSWTLQRTGTFTMANTTMTGMGVCSGTTTQLCTGTFSNVTLTSP